MAHWTNFKKGQIHGKFSGPYDLCDPIPVRLISRQIMWASFLQPASEGQPNSEQIKILHLQLSMSKVCQVLKWKPLWHLAFLYKEMFLACTQVSLIFSKILICEFTMGVTKSCLLVPTFQGLYGKCPLQDWFLGSFWHPHHIVLLGVSHTS